MSDNVAPSAQQNKAGLSVGNDKHSIMDRHSMMGRVTFMASGESDEKSFLAGYDKGLNAGWALGFHEAYEVLAKEGRLQAQTEPEIKGSGGTVAVTEKGGGTEETVASKATVDGSSQLGSGCEPIMDTAAQTNPTGRYRAKPNPLVLIDPPGEYQFALPSQDSLDSMDAKQHGGAERHEETRRDSTFTTGGGLASPAVSSGSRCSDQSIRTALDSIVNSAPILNLSYKAKPAMVAAQSVTSASIVTSAPMEDVFYNPEPTIINNETTTDNNKVHTPAPPTLRRRKAFPVINHTTPVSSPETSPPLRCVDKPDWPKPNSHNKSITLGKWTTSTPTPEKPKEEDADTKPSTLYNIPLPHTISPVAPSGLHDPALCARTRPRYPELAEYNVYELQRAGLTFGENYHRVLIGPLGAASRDAWKNDCGRVYLSGKLAAADAREIAKKREEEKRGGEGGDGGKWDEVVPSSGIEFCQMVSDTRHKVWYVLAMFSSTAKADAALMFFKDGYACGGSIMWAWTFLDKNKE